MTWEEKYDEIVRNNGYLSNITLYTTDLWELINLMRDELLTLKKKLIMQRSEEVKW